MTWAPSHEELVDLRRQQERARLGLTPGSVVEAIVIAPDDGPAVWLYRAVSP